MNENEVNSKPIIGILTDEIRNKKILISHLKKKEFQYYMDACNEIGALSYIFTLNNIDLNNKKVRGYIQTIDEHGNMVVKEDFFPLPDLILNRALISSTSPGYQKINKLANAFPNIKIMNRITRVYKWKMHKTLQSSSKINKYLPNTILFTGKNSLEKMLNIFSCVYLKPTGRSLGLGIVRITKNKENEYQAKYRRKKINHSIIGSLDEILPKLKPLMGKRIYIVQQGIPLATYDGNIFDIRVCMQKDGTGEWSTPRWMIRAAESDNVVTNIAAGGNGLDVETVISELFEKRAGQIMDEIKDVGLSISKIIDKKFLGVADIGIDLGITATGKLYFIEANLRQSRLSSVSDKEYNQWRNTFKKPIYYLNYLYKLK
jgi:glutathione synthase/RimK-type ligase-like ATP-grasp enzyme